MIGPALLAGTRVLDLTSVVSGPVATLRLAQYGAEVIKVEPREGDVLRTLGGASPTGAHSGQYLHLNRGKQSVGLDLKHPDGRAAVERLLATCDVLVTNMRPEALARLGLDADTVRAGDPKLIHCTITGFGPGGPYRGRPAYDSVVQGAAGLAGLHLARDEAALYVPLLICDHVVGEITAGAVLAAMVARGRTGEGSAIEVPMHETMAAFVLHEHLSRATFDPPVGPPGDTRVLSAQLRPARTQDGWICLSANSDDQCRRMLRVMGREEWLDDPRFRSVPDRVRHMDEWLALREAWLAERTSAEWLDAFAAADVPAMPCHTLDSLADDPHLRAVGLIQHDRHPVEGTTLGIRSTVLVDGQPAPLGRAAGAVGSDTAAVLRDVGCADEVVSDLLQSGGAFVV